MITRIKIDGFKSFVDFSLDLAPFTAVIGTNAGGKSNLIDAFRFLAASVKGDPFDAIEAVRGDAESLFHQYADGSRVDTMRLAVEFSDGSDAVPMRYETQIRWSEAGELRKLVHEAELIRSALVKTDGNIGQAARLLGIARQRLQYLLKTRHWNLHPAVGENLMEIASSVLPANLPDGIREEAKSAIVVDLLSEQVTPEALKDALMVRRYIRAAYGFQNQYKFSSLDASIGESAATLADLIAA